VFLCSTADKSEITLSYIQNVIHFLIGKPIRTIQLLRKIHQAPSFETKQELKAYEQNQAVRGVPGSVTGFPVFIL